jgi:hypothetical protein
MTNVYAPSEGTIQAHCKSLRMPMIAPQFGSMAEQAFREKKSHLGYLEALLLAEIEEKRARHIPTASPPPL